MFHYNSFFSKIIHPWPAKPHNEFYCNVYGDPQGERWYGLGHLTRDGAIRGSALSVPVRYRIRVKMKD